MLELYDKGLEMFGEQQWKRAHKFFIDARGVLSDDNPTSLYIDRCNKYIKKPPSKGWSGIYKLESK
jgi:adenylate cyclase